MALVRAGFIPVPPGAKPGFAHADVYHAPTTITTRLYVAHTGADRIDVIDCDANIRMGVAVFAEQERSTESI